MTREEIISTARVLLIAGSETTATLLSGATYYLLTNPEILGKLQAEIRGTFQAENDITLQSLSNSCLLPYLEAVLTESLRMYPPVPANLPRITGPGGDVVDGRFVPANVRIFTGSRASRSSSWSSSLTPWCHRPPSVYTNGQRSNPATTSLTRPHLFPSDGFQRHQSVTVATTDRRCNRFRWGRATALGKSECQTVFESNSFIWPRGTNLDPLIFILAWHTWKCDLYWCVYYGTSTSPCARRVTVGVIKNRISCGISRLCG